MTSSFTLRQLIITENSQCRSLYSPRLDGLFYQPLTTNHHREPLTSKALFSRPQWLFPSLSDNQSSQITCNVKYSLRLSTLTIGLALSNDICYSIDNASVSNAGKNVQISLDPTAGQITIAACFGFGNLVVRDSCLLSLENVAFAYLLSQNSNTQHLSDPRKNPGETAHVTNAVSKLSKGSNFLDSQAHAG